ncbi:MAG: FAD-binding protein [Clostridia bacterium]|nr:FAD-binding protein [Clostridia bacterium]MBR6498309.1 FAD-binding protein [Clostridia bacterium]
MAKFAVLERKCDGCGRCLDSCPFGAIELENGVAQMNGACKSCGTCLKACPQKAIIKLETRTVSVDKTAWRDILVLGEVSAGKLHPVSLELIGKALELAAPLDYNVNAVLAGSGVGGLADELKHYGVKKVYVYDAPELRYFRADAYAACVEDTIRSMKPSVVLVGSTLMGRSLAPRLATRFHTGLTADCTKLELRENSDLVQIRPAFGGNIMAQIITANTRPQFATVRYKVMDAPQRREEASGETVTRKIPRGVFESRITLMSSKAVPPKKSISDAEVLVVGGRGLQKSADLEMVKELARLLGGDWAVSRPLVEKGWAGNERQVGLSGRTVRPKLIITCGVSGAIQFASCMNMSEYIVAINTDPQAPIFKVAHTAIVGDIYEILPQMIRNLKEGANERL